MWNNSYLFSHSSVYSNRFFNKVASRVIRQKMAICLQRPTKNALIAIFAEAIFGLL